MLTKTAKQLIRELEQLPEDLREELARSFLEDLKRNKANRVDKNC